MSMFKSKHSGWTWDLKRTPFGGGKGGGGGQPAPTQTTVQNTNIPEYAKPYVETMLGTAQQQIFNYDGDGNVTGMKPYTPYSNNATDYIAGFSPLQQQAQSNVANMQSPSGYGTGANFAQASGLGALNTANSAAGYGGIGAQQGLNYGQNATNPSAVAGYMNPYLQNTLAPAMQLQNQQFGMLNAQNQGQATQQGAFGGGRQAVMQGLNQQNQMLAQNQLVGNAYSQAYDKANQNMQTASQLGMQGAGIGLQGTQGQQAAYQQLGAQGANLANIAGQQNQSDLAINQAQQASGAAQQAQQQNVISQQIQNYATGQQYPMMQLANMSNLLRGLPMQSTATQTYQAAPSAVSQLGGLGATALGAYGASGGFKSAAQGGVMKSYAAGGAVAFDVGGSVESDLNNMDDAHLMQEAKNSPSTVIRQEAAKILAERAIEKQAMSQGVGASPAAAQMQMAGGGIVAFADGGAAKDQLTALQALDTNMPQDYSEYSGNPMSQTEYYRQKEMAKNAIKSNIPVKNVPTPEEIAIRRAAFGSAPIAPAPASDTTPPATPPATTPATTPAAPAVATTAKPDSLGRFDANNQSAPAGLGNTQPAQAKNGAPKTTAEPKTEKDAFDHAIAGIKRLEAAGFGVPTEERKAMAEQYKADRAQAKEDKTQNLWMALIAGGAKAMASKSPYAGVGIGEGIGAGVESAAYANKAYNEALKAAQSGELDLAKLNNNDRTNLLHYSLTGAVSELGAKEKAAALKQRYAEMGQTRSIANDAKIAGMVSKIETDTYNKARAAVDKDINFMGKSESEKEAAAQRAKDAALSKNNSYQKLSKQYFGSDYEAPAASGVELPKGVTVKKIG